MAGIGLKTGARQLDEVLELATNKYVLQIR